MSLEEMQKMEKIHKANATVVTYARRTRHMTLDAIYSAEETDARRKYLAALHYLDQVAPYRAPVP